MKILIDNGHGNPPLTGGKCSPDGSHKEYEWAREFASMLDRELSRRGFDSQRIVIETTDVSISERVRRVNAWCKKLGAKNVLLVSIHNNAGSESDKNKVKDAFGSWKTARGFSVFVSKNSSSNSKKLAQSMTEKAKQMNLLGNRSVPTEKYWTWSWTKADIGILKNTNCPAVLTENMFMDNKEDLAFLRSDEGKQKLLDLHVNAIVEYVTSMR